MTALWPLSLGGETPNGGGCPAAWAHAAGHVGGIMHELGVLIEVARIVEELAKEQKIEKVQAIVLQIGELSSVVPQFMQEYFPMVVDMKPLFKDTKLEIEMLPGMAKCQHCGTVFNVIEHKGYCPQCNSYDKDLLCGREFMIKEIVVPNG